MKYRALHTIAIVFKVFGWITLVLGVLSSCGWAGMMVFGGLASLAAASGTTSDASSALLGGGAITVIVAIVTVIIGLIFTGIYALLLFAFSEGISVFLDIEQNTREMVTYLRR